MSEKLKGSLFILVGLGLGMMSLKIQSFVYHKLLNLFYYDKLMNGEIDLRQCTVATIGKNLSLWLALGVGIILLVTGMAKLFKAEKQS